MEGQNNERIAKQIWEPLQRYRHFFGWLPDLNSIKVIKNGTSFYLGKLKALVMIQYENITNSFKLTIKPDNEENEITYNSLFLDNLVPVIDANVKYGTSCYDYICHICGLSHKVAV